MSASALESEDLENVPLVRMEDVQPSRTYDAVSRRRSDEEVLGTCVVDDIEYDNECEVNDDDDDDDDGDDDDDSNIGSMVSIPSEEVIDDDSEPEMIVPDPLDIKPNVIKQEIMKQPPSSWPTLEILPGGVIKKPDKFTESDCPYPSNDDDIPQESELMYACAKCLLRFKYLFCLVKHVKEHEVESKKNGLPKTTSNPKTPASNYTISRSNNKRKMIMCVKSHKKKPPKK